jgi:hypothetical protein
MVSDVLGPDVMRPDEDVPIVPEVSSTRTDEPILTEDGLQESDDVPETTAPLVPNVAW